MHRPFALVVLFALLLSSPAFAWGNTGHRVTGAIAERHLSKQARRLVRSVLGNETLAEASTWPDFMRASPDPFWRSAGAYHTVLAPEGHYAGMPPAGGDAVTALEVFSATLRDRKAQRAERQRALRFIVHIVGDLHNPLHACGAHDHCGGDVKLDFLGKPTNLHMLWDEGLIDREQLSYSEWTSWLDARITPAQLQAWRQPDARVWIAESAALRPSVYPGAGDPEKAYAFRFKPIIDQRLSQAGVRIAAYLDWVCAK